MTHGNAEIFGPICAYGCKELRLLLLCYLEFVSEKLIFFLFCIPLFPCVRIHYILRCFTLLSPLPEGKQSHKTLTIIALDTSIVSLICRALSKHHISASDIALSGKDGTINRRMPPVMCGKQFQFL